LTFLLVGSFYAVFSIFMRTSFTHEQSLYNFANLIEKLYILFLCLVIMFSITRKVEKAETVFNIGAFVMGIFMILTIYNAVIWFQIHFSNNVWELYISIGLALITYVYP
jgi:hypothetical protein